MIVRTEIFYFNNKEDAINLAKKLKGYVDVENGNLLNPHIDIKPFHNIIIFCEEKTNVENLLSKYYSYISEKNIYIISSKHFNVRYSKIRFLNSNNSLDSIARIVNLQIE